MGYECYITDSPVFVPENFREAFDTPCDIRRADPMDFEWYKGSGVPRDRHPLGGSIKFRACAACESENVLVIAAQWNVHRMNGDEYYDYELVCDDCGKFTRVSFADND